MSDPLQHTAWNGRPERLRDVFIMTKVRAGALTLSATCMLFTHPKGCELRLAIDEHDWQATSVVRSPRDVVKTAQHWRAALARKGWTDAPRPGVH